MFVSRTFRRTNTLFRSILRYASAEVEVQRVDKEALKQLRKRTGYSYVNCRKALLQFGSENLDDAVKWLKDMALKEGWEKAAKVGKRATTQGVVCALVVGNKAAIVEMKCETDFVARNEEFKKFVEEVTRLVISSTQVPTVTSDKFETVTCDIELLKSAETGIKVDEMLASIIGKLGENITLSRAQLLVARPDVELYAYAHPREGNASINMGKYAAIVGLRRPNATSFPSKTLGEQLCQHIVGMRTESLGTPPPPPSAETTQSAEKHSDVEAEYSKKAGEEEGDEDMNAFYQGGTTEIDESETALLRQMFMLNPTLTVHEYISGHGAIITDFHRVELGEPETSPAR